MIHICNCITAINLKFTQLGALPLFVNPVEFIEAPRPTLSILCYYNYTQANTSIISRNISRYCSSTLLCDVGNPMRCRKPECDVGNHMWFLMETVLRSNSNHKEGSKLKLWENSAHTHSILWKVFSPQNSKHFCQRSNTVAVEKLNQLYINILISSKQLFFRS